MQYFSNQRKQKPYIHDTRPSHNESCDSLKRSLKNSQSVQTFGLDSTKNPIDSFIKFSNGWVFQGQHFKGKFHGWGRLFSSEQKVVYKGNFENGFFHNCGQITFHEIFSYLFSIEELSKWVENHTHIAKHQQHSLRQIQVKNPFRTKGNKIISKFRQDKNFKESSLHNKSQSSIQSFKKSDLKITWLKYGGEFKEGNATGFGTLKILIKTGQQSKQLERTIKIIGKFKQGKIITGAIKG